MEAIKILEDYVNDGIVVPFWEMREACNTLLNEISNDEELKNRVLNLLRKHFNDMKQSLLSFYDYFVPSYIYNEDYLFIKRYEFVPYNSNKYDYNMDIVIYNVFFDKHIDNYTELLDIHAQKIKPQDINDHYNIAMSLSSNKTNLDSINASAQAFLQKNDITSHKLYTDTKFTGKRKYKNLDEIVTSFEEYIATQDEIPEEVKNSQEYIEKRGKIIGRYGELLYIDLLNCRQYDDVVWVPKVLGDGFGYDFVVFSAPNNDCKLIELKATTKERYLGSPKVTDNEINVFRKINKRFNTTNIDETTNTMSQITHILIDNFKMKSLIDFDCDDKIVLDCNNHIFSPVKDIYDLDEGYNYVRRK